MNPRDFERVLPYLFYVVWNMTLLAGGITTTFLHWKLSVVAFATARWLAKGSTEFCGTFSECNPVGPLSQNSVKAIYWRLKNRQFYFCQKSDKGSAGPLSQNTESLRLAILPLVAKLLNALRKRLTGIFLTANFALSEF